MFQAQRAWKFTRTFTGLLLALGLFLPAEIRPKAAGPRGQAQASNTSVPTSPPHISSPVAGENLQGMVDIRGSTALNGFAVYAVDFSYANDQTRTWFEIGSGGQNVSNGVLARWDTRSITDGNYRLRLRVMTTEGKTHRFVVEDVRIRNYTPLDTPTPTLAPTASLLPTATPTPTATDMNTPVPTPTAKPPVAPTPLPRNPAEVASDQIWANTARGAAAAILLFAIFGVFIRLRRN